MCIGCVNVIWILVIRLFSIGFVVMLMVRLIMLVEVSRFVLIVCIEGKFINIVVSLIIRIMVMVVCISICVWV